jgi:hypothetical protein
VSPQAGSIALRTKFLDDISQALRAPITSICLAARIIRKHYDSTPEVVAHFGDTLLAEADRLGQTVDEFLELARFESGLVEWHEDEVDAADLIQRAVAEVESVAVSYGVSVAFTMEPGLPPLHVDRERVAQALTILLAMAVRSASEGSEIVIQIAGAHGGWVFTVGGTSFVYPHAEARKVHVRAEGAPVVDQPESRPDGLGLGLCLCREIVARYQGRFWVEGSPGTSGCARFTIPYRQHRRATIAATASTDAAASTTVQSERPKGAPGIEPGYAAGAGTAPVDLELRREMAVKALQERAASQPRVDAATATENEPTEARTTQSSDIESTTHVPDARSSVANVTDGATESTAATPAATETVRRFPKAPRTASRDTTPGREDLVRTPATPPPRPRARRPAPTPRTHRRAREPASDSLSASDPRATPRRSEPEEHAVEVEVEVEVEDAPVQAPVSGTMITATHRTAGPPVLANPGVPALSGVQSAATAAMQGSDELLLEIAEAQSPDGHALVVSEEVRSLLASAPGTLPAVAGQNTPAVAGRAAHTPSRRRVVQAPWVALGGTVSRRPDEGAQAQPVEPGRPARRTFEQRLAKRLAHRQSATRSR